MSCPNGKSNADNEGVRMSKECFNKRQPRRQTGTLPYKRAAEYQDSKWLNENFGTSDRDETINRTLHHVASWKSAHGGPTSHATTCGITPSGEPRPVLALDDGSTARGPEEEKGIERAASTPSPPPSPPLTTHRRRGGKWTPGRKVFWGVAALGACFAWATGTDIDSSTVHFQNASSQNVHNG